MEFKDKKICDICDKTFSSFSNLNKHLRLIHGVEPKSRGKHSLVCPSCFLLLNNYIKLRDHILAVHKIELFKEETLFGNFEEFQVWKEKKEKELKCSYVKTSGNKGSGKTQKVYYVCHRSVKTTKSASITQTNQKLPKSQGFSKLNVTCPSTLELICKETEFKANLFTPHLGHKCNLSHINLTKTERKQIAGKIAEGVSFQRIFDDIRDGINSKEHFGRLSILDRQDLRNISRDFSLKEHIQLHKSDVISVQLWLERFKCQKDDFPVLFYKAQGSTDCSDIYKTNDFVLIFMTKFQENQLITFGSDKICVDSTHGTTNYDFLLTTLMVVDEFGEGVPVAFMISNKVDTCVIANFFKVIKIQTGDIKCKVFMSDDAPEFYNAWTSIMSVPENRLLCTWHVDKNLNKIKGDQEVKIKVYKSLRMLLQTKELSDFHEMLDIVLTELIACEHTKEFGEYFKKYYADKYCLWAYCCRKGLGINTNMYLESMHRTLKHIYFQGIKNKRVDTCLHSLLKLVRDIIIKKAKRNIKGSNSYRMELINKSHLRSANINSKNIFNINEITWIVKSVDKTDEQYTVEKQTEECFKRNKTCYLFCKKCQTCVHEYKCTCLDYFIKNNFCKHIHAVIQKCTEEVNTVIYDSNIGDIDDAIIEDLIGQNVKEKENINQDIKAKLDILYELLSSKTLTFDTKTNIGKKLDNIIELVAKEDNVGFQNVSSEPGNKKSEKQLRFTSTKKKRITNDNDVLKKPTSSDIATFKENIQVVKNDHSYTKCIGLFNQ